MFELSQPKNGLLTPDDNVLIILLHSIPNPLRQPNALESYPPPPSINARTFARSLALLIPAVLLLSIVGLSSSSEAQRPDQLQLDRLWSGVLGCADRHDSLAVRNRFDSPDSLENIGDDAIPAGASSNYSECGKLALQSASSRMLVEAIEDSLRQGGLAFSENFRLDSSISWVWEENFTGEVDAVIPLDLEPLLGAYGGGVEQALFFQPGLIFWPGLEDDDRVDGNIGLVYRQHISPNLVAGGSLFYDYDFERGHERFGFGVDVQSRFLQAGLNYYHPLTDWREGRTDYEQHALRGMDVRVGLASGRVQFDTSLGIWRFEGEDEEKTKWRPSFDIEAGYRIYPGVFLQSRYERHDSGDSLGSRWDVGLAFRFSLPGLDGAFALADPATEPNLYEPVEREKRILYEERLGIPRVNLEVMNARVAEPTATEESETAVVMAELGKPLDEDVTLNIVVADTSTADFGEDGDFTYGHKVYELDADTGEQSAPANLTDCPVSPCEALIPAGVTRFDIEASILMDSTVMEIPEFIDFRIEVPDDYAGLVRGSGEARVTIGAQGNTVAFASDAPRTLDEFDESGMGGDTVEVAVEVKLPSPTPITLNVATAGEAMPNTDYRISTTRLTIPAMAESASFTLTGINNEIGEGNKDIQLTLSGNLPDGWTFSDAEHEVTLRDDDRSIFFASDAPRSIDEPASSDDATRMIEVGITEAPSAPITVMISAGGAGETAGASDYTFTQTSITFAARDSSDANLRQSVSIAVHPDSDAETSETIVLRITDDSGTPSSREAEGSGFSLGSDHTITIPANDNTVGFASGAATTLGENGGTARVAVNVDRPAPVAITLNVTTGGEADPGDFRIDSRTLTIEAGQPTGTIMLTGVNNNVGEGHQTIDLTISPNGTLPNGWTLGDSEHAVDILDDDLSVGFARASDTVDEPSSDTDHTIDIEITNAPSANITLEIQAVSGSTASTSDDVSFSPSTVTFTAGDSTNLTKTITINVKSDTTKELSEYLDLRLGNSDGSLTSDGNAFSFGQQDYRLNINASDNTVSINSDMSHSTLDENGGTASVVVSVEEPSPTAITLNVSAASTSTAMEGTHYTVPATLIIPPNSDTGTLTLTGINNQTEQSSALTIDLQISGTLPKGWSFDPSDLLTHQLTIADDERPTVGWTVVSAQHTAPASVSNTYTAMVRMSKSPTTSSVTLGVDVSASSATEGLGSSQDFALFGTAPSGCARFIFPKDATGNDLVRSCTVTIRPSAAGKNIVMTLTDSLGNVSAEGLTISPATQTITVNSP